MKKKPSSYHRKRKYTLKRIKLIITNHWFNLIYDYNYMNHFYKMPFIWMPHHLKAYKHNMKSIKLIGYKKYFYTITLYKKKKEIKKNNTYVQKGLF